MRCKIVNYLKLLGLDSFREMKCRIKKTQVNENEYLYVCIYTVQCFEKSLNKFLPKLSAAKIFFNQSKYVNLKKE